MTRPFLLTLFLIGTLPGLTQIVGGRVDKYVAQNSIDTFLVYSFPCSGFGAPLDSNNKEIFDYYRASKHFSFEPPEDYAIYPPLSALDQSNTKTNTFRFITHPHLFFKFKEGKLIIENRKSYDQEVYSKPFIKFLFDDEEQCDAAYKMLVQEFTKLSSRRRIENIAFTKNAEFTDDNSIQIKKVTI